MTWKHTRAHAQALSMLAQRARLAACPPGTHVFVRHLSLACGEEAQRPGLGLSVAHLRHSAHDVVDHARRVRVAARPQQVARALQRALDWGGGRRGAVGGGVGRGRGRRSGRLHQRAHCGERRAAFRAHKLRNNAQQWRHDDMVGLRGAVLARRVRCEAIPHGGEQRRRGVRVSSAQHGISSCLEATTGARVHVAKQAVQVGEGGEPAPLGEAADARNIRARAQLVPRRARGARPQHLARCQRQTQRHWRQFRRHRPACRLGRPAVAATSSY